MQPIHYHQQQKFHNLPHHKPKNYFDEQSQYLLKILSHSLLQLNEYVHSLTKPEQNLHKMDEILIKQQNF
jgi:hypothetical protein